MKKRWTKYIELKGNYLKNKRNIFFLASPGSYHTTLVPYCVIRIPKATRKSRLDFDSMTFQI